MSITTDGLVKFCISRTLEECRVSPPVISKHFPFLLWVPMKGTSPLKCLTGRADFALSPHMYHLTLPYTQVREKVKENILEQYGGP